MSLPLNGTNQYLSIADSPLLTFPDADWAMQIWMYRASNEGTLSSFLISWYATGGTPNWNLWAPQNSSRYDAGSLLFFTRCDGNAAHMSLAKTGIGASLGWRHILIQRSGDVFTGYFDGAAVFSTEAAAYTTTNYAGPMYLGAYATLSDPYWFQGKIAEVAKFHQAFDADDRAALAGGAIPGNYDPVWWRKLLNNSSDGVGELSITEVNSPSYDAADHPVSYGTAAMALENQFVAPFMRSQFVR